MIQCPECDTPLSEEQIRKRRIYCSRRCSGRANRRKGLRKQRGAVSALAPEGIAPSHSSRPAAVTGFARVVEQPPPVQDPSAFQQYQQILVNPLPPVVPPELIRAATRVADELTRMNINKGRELQLLDKIADTLKKIEDYQFLLVMQKCLE